MRTPRPWTVAEVAAAKAWEAKLVAEGRCPWSGLPLGDGEDRRRCDICDCPGYPLRVGSGEQDARMENEG